MDRLGLAPGSKSASFVFQSTFLGDGLWADSRGQGLANHFYVSVLWEHPGGQSNIGRSLHFLASSRATQENQGGKFAGTERASG